MSATTLQFFGGFMFLLVVLFLICNDHVHAVCCPPPCVFGDWKLKYHKCGDCSKPTPYCSYGGCNIFGCNCEGGCRPTYCESCARGKRSMRFHEPDFIKEYLESVFRSGDANEDGLLNESETKLWFERYKRHVSEGQARNVKTEFLKMDTNGDGLLSRDEIDN